MSSWACGALDTLQLTSFKCSSRLVKIIFVANKILQILSFILKIQVTRTSVDLTEPQKLRFLQTIGFSRMSGGMGILNSKQIRDHMIEKHGSSMSQTNEQLLDCETHPLRRTWGSPRARSTALPAECQRVLLRFGHSFYRKARTRGIPRQCDSYPKDSVAFQQRDTLRSQIYIYHSTGQQ